MKRRCHEFGGRTASGQPCGRVVTDGRCHLHDDQAAEERDALKAKFLEEYSKSLVKLDAARECETSVVTVWRMEQDDPLFKAAVSAIEEAAQDLRYELGEDSMFKRIVDGSAPAVLHMFFLVNESRRRGDGRWKHVHQIQQSNFNFDLENATDEELQRIKAGEDPVEVVAETRGHRASTMEPIEA